VQTKTRRKQLETGRLGWPPGPEGDKLTDDLTSTAYRPPSPASLFVCRSAALRPRALRPQLKRDSLGSELIRNCR
jgi:hypothetical protein